MGASASAHKRTALMLLNRGGPPPKILVLGCMGAGKSTLCRMLLKYGRAPNPILQYYRHTVENNMLEVWKALYTVANDLGVNVAALQKEFNTILDFRHREQLSPGVVDAITRLSQSSIYDDCLRKKKYLQTMPYNYQYFIFHTPRILARNFTPTETDVIYSYAITMGTDYRSIKFSFSRYEILELPGHHIFRRRWNDFMKNTTVLIYVVDLAELCEDAFYDGHLKDKTLSIYKDLVNNPLLVKAGIILVFNKKDAFDEASSGYDFSRLAQGIRSPQEALMLYKSCFSAIDSHRGVYSHTISMTKTPTLTATVVHSLTTILNSNRDSVDTV